MPSIPRERGLDHTLALLKEGYDFIPSRCRRFGSDVFETRLLLRPHVCMSGPEAAQVFYHPDRFTRRGAMPPTTQRLLQDKGSVQALGGEAHRRRKQLFLGLMREAAIARLCDRVQERWRQRLPAWQAAGAVVLHDEVVGILGRAVLDWAGMAASEAEAAARTGELAAMIDGAGSFGPRAWLALLRRRRTEQWARRRIAAVRRGTVEAPAGSALAAVAAHREADGTPLDVAAAAVELLNVLRPTVAVAWYVTFAALALHQHAPWRERVADDVDLECFVQEVRRDAPFFPLVAGRVQVPFAWRGREFRAGERVVLDLYGTNHDERSFEAPSSFRPERFRGRDLGAFDLVPQGGGDVEAAHRCPGEWITIAIMRTAVRLLASDMDYRVPPQDLRIDRSRFPTLPTSRFVIADVRGRVAGSHRS